MKKSTLFKVRNVLSPILLLSIFSVGAIAMEPVPLTNGGLDSLMNTNQFTQVDAKAEIMHFADKYNQEDSNQSRKPSVDSVENLVDSGLSLDDKDKSQITNSISLNQENVEEIAGKIVNGISTITSPLTTSAQSAIRSIANKNPQPVKENELQLNIDVEDIKKVSSIFLNGVRYIANPVSAATQSAVKAVNNRVQKKEKEVHVKINIEGVKDATSFLANGVRFIASPVRTIAEKSIQIAAENSAKSSSPITEPVQESEPELNINPETVTKTTAAIAKGVSFAANPITTAVNSLVQKAKNFTADFTQEEEDGVTAEDSEEITEEVSDAINTEVTEADPETQTEVAEQLEQKSSQQIMASKEYKSLNTYICNQNARMENLVTKMYDFQNKMLEQMQQNSNMMMQLMAMNMMALNGPQVLPQEGYVRYDVSKEQNLDMNRYGLNMLSLNDLFRDRSFPGATYNTFNVSGNYYKGNYTELANSNNRFLPQMPQFSREFASVDKSFLFPSMSEARTSMFNPLSVSQTQRFNNGITLQGKTPRTQAMNFMQNEEMYRRQIDHRTFFNATPGTMTTPVQALPSVDRRVPAHQAQQQPATNQLENVVK